MLNHITDVYNYIPLTAKLLHWSWVREENENSVYNGVFMTFIDPKETKKKNYWEIIINPNENELQSEEEQMKILIRTRMYQPPAISN